MNINSNGILANTYDAIVVGSGISGGWAAKELAEKGLKILVLERGKEVKHITDYPTMTKHPWELPHMDKVSVKDAAERQVQKRTGYTVSEAYKHFFVNDKEHPFVEKQSFGWMRGYHVGGRSITWGKQSYRLSPMDFEANEKDGIATPWPVKYDEIAPWYSKAEKFIGVSGSIENLPQVPDGEFQPVMEMNCVEKEVKKKVEGKWNGRKIIMGRAAHLTAPTEEQTALGRASCQYRNMCMRGCPFGGYFSSQAATLPAAARTGNMTMRTNSIVHSIIYNDDKAKAEGVRVIDQTTGQMTEFFAKIIFLNASTVPSTSILMNTESKRYQNGMDESDSLGRYLMDHHLAVGANGVYEGFEDRYYYGRRPNGLYIPRYRNVNETSTSYIRGFGYQGGASRQGWGRGVNTDGFGAAFKDKISEPGAWSLGIQGFGECLPYYENRIYLDKTTKDKWGMPMLIADASFKENEMKMRVDMQQDAIDMLEASGFKDVKGYDGGANIGLGIHEMGTARMGTSAKNSVLNKYNQVWGALNVFCTDGSFMTSAGCQNPSLTYMAFTARAADYAVSELKKGNL